MTTPDDIRQRLGFISVYDEQIATLKQLRNDHVYFFEELAAEYCEQFPPPESGGRGPLWCTACRFAYRGTNSSGDLVFGTRCRFDGDDAGDGVTVPLDKISQIVMP